MTTPALNLPSRRVLLALSGGADSVALFLLMLEQGIRPEAAHCNFHLRGEESNRDEEFVRRLCAEHDVALSVRNFDVHGECKTTGESVEMAARRLRYAWFEQLRAEHGLDYICTAHHRDDQVETVLLNLVRGTGLAGLRGMLPVQGRICRPLLNVWGRAEIQQYLEGRNQQWVEDSTNASTIYQRNLVRHEIIPLLQQLNPQAENHIAQAAQHLQEAERMLNSTQENWQEEHCIVLPDGLRIPFSKHTRVGAELNADGPLMAVRTAAGIEIRIRPQQLPPTPVLPERKPLPDNYLEQVKKCAKEGGAWIDAAKAVPPFYVRSLQNGDRFQPLGMSGTRLVSDYLTDRHRSRIDKAGQLVVCDQLGIVWLCGETISQRVAITSETAEIFDFPHDCFVVS